MTALGRLAPQPQVAMRVAMIDPSLFTLPYDRALMRGLSHAGHDVTLHGRSPGLEDNDGGGIDLDADFYRLSSLGAVARLPNRLRLPIKGVDHLVSMLRLRSRLRAQRPDIIHFQWLPLPVIDRRMLAGLRAIAPLVLTVHDTNPFNGNPSASMQARGFAESLRMFDQLIVHTLQGRDRLLAFGIEAARISVLPHGLIEGLPGTVSPNATRGELTFLLFGKLKPYKGVDVLIEAFARLPEPMRRQATMRVVGKAYLPLGPLHALAAERGVADRLRLEPRFVSDDEVNELFSPDVIAVFPYREIEASGALSYALVNGRPVIASALGSFAEAIQDGVQGLLVPPDDAGALSAAMGRMIGDRDFTGRCAAQSRKLAEAVPNWDTIALRTIATYAVAQHRAAERFGGKPAWHAG